jgi:cytochrome c-type biogenesis protein CcmF
MTVLGHWVVVGSLVASVFATFLYFRAATKDAPLGPARRALRVGVGGVVLASILLFLLVLNHDFTNGYVYSYSSRSLPFLYLISSFYAGQEGSFLFWVLCSAIFALMLRKFVARRRLEASVMAVYMGVQSLLLVLLAAKSPFHSIWEMFPELPLGQVPVDGRGLNPLLQNFWMAIHPPVLFIGFAALAIPFSVAVASLWKKRYTLLSDIGFPWVLFGALALGTGIMLGAYWAYGVLGWGGYWGWDPVENSSLVPWITSVALVHTLIAQRRRQKYVRTNFALAILSFVLVVYSTFLTRSGVLGDSSVHSFTDPGSTVYLILLGFLAVCTLVGAGLLIVRRKDLRPAESGSGLITRESALGLGTLALLLSAAVILFGTSLPIMTTSTTVEPSFYDKTNLPIAIAMCLLIGLSLFTQWGMEDWKQSLRLSLSSLGVAVVLTAVVIAAGVRDPLVAGFLFAAFFALIVNMQQMIAVIRVKPGHIGGKVAHAGLALFFLGVIATGKFTEEVHIALPQNQPQIVLGRTLTYLGHKPTSDGKYAFEVRVDEGNSSFVLAPVMFDAGQQGTMRNPDIASFLTADLYLSPVSVEHGSSTSGNQYTIQKGQTVPIGGMEVTFVRFDMGAHGADEMGAGGGMAVGSVLEVRKGDETETVTPVTIYGTDREPVQKGAESRLAGGRIDLVSMNVGMGEGGSTVTIVVQGAGQPAGHAEALIVEASIKPFIILVWAGTVVLMAGIVLSMIQRTRESAWKPTNGKGRRTTLRGNTTSRMNVTDVPIVPQ